LESAGSELDVTVEPSINQHAFLMARALTGAGGRLRSHFNIPVCVLFTGSVDAATLERALNEVVRRHTALQSEFPPLTDRSPSALRPLLQAMTTADGWARIHCGGRIRPNAGVALRVQKTDDNVIRRMRPVPGALVCDEALREIAPDAAPLMTATYHRGDAGRHLLVLVFHHLVCDRWSIGVFLEEVYSTYRDLCRGTSPTLPPPHRQFSDFASWQRARLFEETNQARLAECQQRYRSDMESLLVLDDFPMLRSRRRAPLRRHGLSVLRFSSSTSTRVNAYCRSRRITRYVVALAGTYLLCYLHARRQSLTLWGAFANRRAGDERVIGWMSEGRALGITITPGMSFDRLVEAVRDTVLNAIASQDLPLAAIQHGAASGRSSHRSDVLHITTEMWDGGLTRPTQIDDKLAATLVRVPYNRTTVPNVFRLTFDPTPDVTVRCVFERGRISTDGVHTFLAQFENAVSRALDSPSQPLASFEDLVRARGTDVSGVARQ
jgi:hypothetical protein